MLPRASDRPHSPASRGWAATVGRTSKLSADRATELKTDQPIDYRSPERRLTAEQKCGCEWEPPLVVRPFGKSLEPRESIWETSGVVELHTGGLSGKWVFAGTWLPIAELFEKLNDGVTLDEFLDWYEGMLRGRTPSGSSTVRLNFCGPSGPASEKPKRTRRGGAASLLGCQRLKERAWCPVNGRAD